MGLENVMGEVTSFEKKDEEKASMIFLCVCVCLDNNNDQERDIY